jgi:Spy/CpxP family protein refolding chaperone
MFVNPRAMMLAATLLVASPLMAGNLPNPTLDETKVLTQAQEMQDRTQPEKRAFVARELALSDEQAEKFWPIYGEHQFRLRELNRRRISNILVYARAWNQGSLDDKTANALAKEVIAIEADEVALLKRTYRDASKATSPAQAALYVQIEAKLRARLRFEEADMLPLVK